MAEISFDFQKYVEERKGADKTAEQSGTAYAYPGDQKVLRTLARVTPVTLAVRATGRLWKSRAADELLSHTVKVGEGHQPDLHRNAYLSATRLGMILPTVYVLPEAAGGLLAQTFGSADDACIVLSASLTERLSPEELLFVIGHECGRVQNGHVAYTTSLYYLGSSSSHFVRWIVKPAAAALRSWARRAQVTCDRAGLICSSELLPSISALCRLELGSLELPAGLNPAELLELAKRERAEAAASELGRAYPELLARVTALWLFSETHYFLKASGRKPREDEGKSLTWCDEQTKSVLEHLPRAGE